MSDPIPLPDRLSNLGSTPSARTATGARQLDPSKPLRLLDQGFEVSLRNEQRVLPPHPSAFAAWFNPDHVVP